MPTGFISLKISSAEGRTLGGIGAHLIGLSQQRRIHSQRCDAPPVSMPMLPCWPLFSLRPVTPDGPILGLFAWHSGPTTARCRFMRWVALIYRQSVGSKDAALPELPELADFSRQKGLNDNPEIVPYGLATLSLRTHFKYIIEVSY